MAEAQLVPSPRDRAGDYVITMEEPDDFDFWRDRARLLVQCDVPPDRVIWNEPGGVGNLFALDEGALSQALSHPRVVRASRQFIDQARSVICHSSPDRFGLLYRLLWRLQANPRILEDRADLDVRHLAELAKSVRRDIHKMRAFVRFRRVEELHDNGEAVVERYIAWFEPDHHILRTNASFFVRRFSQMQWSILTPKGSIHWDGHVLSEGPAAQRSDAPADDAAEDLWRAYYSSTFNPARLKVGAMLKEMPRRYWKNMPEAALIPQLIAGAQAREAHMVEQGSAPEAQALPTLLAIEQGLHTCARCPIGVLDNQAVMGEGPSDAVLMLVGEQPGDQEDLAGRPFVGPAGQLLDKHLAIAGIDRSRAYVTNAVKHFKFTYSDVIREGHRLHQSPTAKEIDSCRWWLENERALVKPRIVLAMGASAARGMLGKTVSVSQVRGQPHTLEDGSELWITVHPSYLLRLQGSARDDQEKLFANDLAAVSKRVTQLSACV